MAIPLELKMELKSLGIKNPQRWYFDRKAEAPRYYDASRGMSFEKFVGVYVDDHILYLKQRKNQKKRDK